MDIWAVVPIFTSAGAAPLPTILAALASIAAVAFRPRELVRLCRRRPLAAVTTAVAATVGFVAVAGWLSAGGRNRPLSRAEPRRVARFDWAKVAERLLAQERAGQVPTDPAAPRTKSAADRAETRPLAPAAPETTEPAATDESPAEGALMLGRDASRCGYGGGAAPTQLHPLWSYRPEETLFLASPAVAGDRIFAAGCQSDLGSYVGLLACLDTRTGRSLWQVSQIGDDDLRPFFSSPALSADGRYLVIGQGLHTDRDCSLLCFDAANGQLRWALKTSLHIESSPAIAADMAVVGAGAIEGPDGKPVGDPGFVVAVRLADGKELWRQPVNDPESSPAVGPDGTVYIGSGFNGNAVVAIRSDSDERLREQQRDRVAWRTPLAQPVTSAVTLTGDLVIAGAGNSDMVRSHQHAQGLVVALDRRSGEVRWQAEFDDAVLGPIAVRDDTLVCPCRTGEVTALSVRDGQVLWRTRISGQAPVLAGCAFTGQRVYAVSNDGFLAVLDPHDGKVLGKVYLNDQGKPGTGLTMSSPQVAAGRVVVGSETGGLQCFGESGHQEQ